MFFSHLRATPVSPKRASLAAAVLLSAALAWPAYADGLSDARGHIDAGNFSAALTALDEHLREFPQDAEARFTRGLVLVKLTRTDEAIQMFADLTRDYPQLPEPYNNLAVLYAQRGDYEKSRDALEAALATHPSYATAHENLGDVYTALATAAYNRALVLDDSNETVRVKLSLLNQLDSSSVGDTQVATAQPSTPPATAQPAPASTTPVAPVSQAPANTDALVDGVRRALFDWAEAWSNQNVEGYLDSYDVSFLPDDGQSRSAWNNERRRRVAAPGFIRIELIEPTIEILGNGRATVTVGQVYESDTYSDRVTKLMEFRKRGDTWRIVRETVVSTG